MRALKWLLNSMIALLSLVVVIALVLASLPSGALDGKTNQIAQEDLIRWAKDGMVDSITVDGNRLIVITYGSEIKSVVQMDGKMDEDGVYRILKDGGVRAWALDDIRIEDRKRADVSWFDFLLQLFPLLVFLGILITISRFLGKSGAKKNSTPDAIDQPLWALFSGQTFISYHIDPEKSKLINRRNLWIPSLFMIGMILLIGVISAKNQITTRGQMMFDTELPGLIGMAFAMLVFIGITISIARKGTNNFREIWTSYELAIGNQWIARKQNVLPTLVIRVEEIQSIDEEIGKGLIVHTRIPGKEIFVPHELVGYEEAVEQLGKIMPISRGKEISRGATEVWLINFGWLGAFATVMILDNFIVAIVAAAVFISLIAWILLISFKAGQALNQSTRWSVLLLPLFFFPMIATRLWYLYLAFFKN